MRTVRDEPWLSHLALFCPLFRLIPRRSLVKCGSTNAGFPSTDVKKYVYNQAGNEGTFPAAPTSYRVGVLDEEGEPLPKGFEKQPFFKG